MARKINIGQRICDLCKKPMGATFYAVQIAGKVTSVAAHPKCIDEYRKKYGDP